jgi:hypothetical protein
MYEHAAANQPAAEDVAVMGAIVKAGVGHEDGVDAWGRVQQSQDATEPGRQKVLQGGGPLVQVGLSRCLEAREYALPARCRKEAALREDKDAVTRAEAATEGFDPANLSLGVAGAVGHEAVGQAVTDEIEAWVAQK